GRFLRRCSCVFCLEFAVWEFLHPADVTDVHRSCVMVLHSVGDRLKGRKLMDITLYVDHEVVTHRSPTKTLPIPFVCLHVAKTGRAVDDDRFYFFWIRHYLLFNSPKGKRPG